MKLLTINKMRYYRSFLVALIIIICSICFGLHYRNILKATNSDIKGYIVLIIDDFGNHGDGTDAMLKLGIPITAAVMPFLPYSQKDADDAHNAGMDVLLHLPMEPEIGKRSWLGPKAITCDLSYEQAITHVNEGLDDIKWAVGINNHMGSRITQDKRLMEAILTVARQRNLCYLDSKTTQKSVVSEIAESLVALYFERDVFLDNCKNQTLIEKQLDKLADIASKKGYAIGIGHVGVEGGTITARAIKAKYPEIEKRGIRFITISQLIKILRSDMYYINQQDYSLHTLKLEIDSH